MEKYCYPQGTNKMNFTELRPGVEELANLSPDDMAALRNMCEELAAWKPSLHDLAAIRLLSEDMAVFAELAEIAKHPEESTANGD